MRLFPSVAAIALCAIAVCSAHGQQAAVTPRVPPRSVLGSGKMSFSFNEHNQVVPSGVQLGTSTLKSESVSPTTGRITVKIYIGIVTNFEKGTTYHCSVNAIGGIIDLDTGTVDGGIESASGFATVTAPGNASCTLSIPYSWTLPRDGGADSGLILAFGVNAVNPHGEAVRSTLQVDGIENLPGNGATSSFVFSVKL